MKIEIDTKKIISPKHGWGLGNEYTVSIGGEELGKFTFTEFVSFFQIIDESNRGNLPTLSNMIINKKITRREK